MRRRQRFAQQPAEQGPPARNDEQLAETPTELPAMAPCPRCGRSYKQRGLGRHMSRCRA